MNKKILMSISIGLLLTGCANSQRSAVPVVDATSQVQRNQAVIESVPLGSKTQTRTRTTPNQQATGSSSVVVMPVENTMPPLQSSPNPPLNSSTMTPGPSTSDPTMVRSWGGNTPNSAPIAQPEETLSVTTTTPLSTDEQLDGPTLALLSTAQQQQSNGDLNGASASLERAQRIAPNEPQVFYQLAQIRLQQGDPAQAEQVARRGLTYANGNSSLQAGLWEIIAKAREQQGDSAGAAQARQRAQGSA